MESKKLCKQIILGGCYWREHYSSSFLHPLATLIFCTGKKIDSILGNFLNVIKCGNLTFSKESKRRILSLILGGKSWCGTRNRWYIQGARIGNEGDNHHFGTMHNTHHVRPMSLCYRGAFVKEFPRRCFMFSPHSKWMLHVTRDVS